MFAVATASCSTTSPRAAARPSSPARSPARSPASRPGLQDKLYLGNLDARARLGLRRRLRRGDVADAPAGRARRLRGRHRRVAHRPRVPRGVVRHLGLDWERYVVQIRPTSGPPRSTRSSATPPRPAVSWWEAKTHFADWCASWWTPTVNSRGRADGPTRPGGPVRIGVDATLGSARTLGRNRGIHLWPAQRHGRCPGRAHRPRTQRNRRRVPRQRVSSERIVWSEVRALLRPTDNLARPSATSAHPSRGGDVGGSASYHHLVLGSEPLAGLGGGRHGLPVLGRTGARRAVGPIVLHDLRALQPGLGSAGFAEVIRRNVARAGAVGDVRPYLPAGGTGVSRSTRQDRHDSVAWPSMPARPRNCRPNPNRVCWCSRRRPRR